MIRFIDEYRNRFSVEFICKALKNKRAGGFITSRGYRQSKARGLSARRLRDAVLVERMRTVHRDNYGVYGVRKMWHALRRACARRKALCTPHLSPTFTLDGSLGGRYRIRCGLQALNQAIVCAEETTGLIHHSDHGSQYVSVVSTSDLPSTGVPLPPEPLGFL
ncbi:IS3 family transposase [Corynebacterium sp. YSMAA1_1_F7]|uniref:IS3 family transposase n=1 Tax=Corynebacterium sp. YSMAA1_1_F7 TaxID=3383590 RepID=UPI0038D1B304